MKVLIVEDEPYARNELKRLLSKAPQQVEVIDCTDSIEDTVEWLNGNPAPDLMFFDIQLSDGLSFEIFNRTSIKTSVIFTTAFDEYAIRAFKVNSIDYLLKPIKQEELNNALNKFEDLSKHFGKKETGLKIEQIEQLLDLQKPSYKARFIARLGDQIKYINVEDIAYFRAEDNEVMVITKENNKYIIDYTLDQLNGVLDPVLFHRINRSYIVTLGAIKKISKYFNSRLHLELIPVSEDTVLISRVKVPDFMQWMDQ